MYLGHFLPCEKQSMEQEVAASGSFSDETVPAAGGYVAFPPEPLWKLHTFPLMCLILESGHHILYSASVYEHSLHARFCAWYREESKRPI